MVHFYCWYARKRHRGSSGSRRGAAVGSRLSALGSRLSATAERWSREPRAHRREPPFAERRTSLAPPRPSSLPSMTEFFQDAPRLGNQYLDDRVLRSYLRRALPDDVRDDVEPGLR